MSVEFSLPTLRYGMGILLLRISYTTSWGPIRRWLGLSDSRPASGDAIHPSDVWKWARGTDSRCYRAGCAGARLLVGDEITGVGLLDGRCELNGLQLERLARRRGGGKRDRNGCGAGSRNAG